VLDDVGWLREAEMQAVNKMEATKLSGATRLMVSVAIHLSVFIGWGAF